MRCYTKLRVSENAEFCATHTPASSSSDGGRRVPCPLDPNHNVAERLLESHVKVSPEPAHVLRAKLSSDASSCIVDSAKQKSCALDGRLFFIFNFCTGAVFTGCLLYSPRWLCITRAVSLYKE